MHAWLGTDKMSGVGRTFKYKLTLTVTGVPRSVVIRCYGFHRVAMVVARFVAGVFRVLAFTVVVDRRYRWRKRRMKQAVKYIPFVFVGPRSSVRARWVWIRRGWGV